MVHVGLDDRLVQAGNVNLSFELRENRFRLFVELALCEDRFDEEDQTAVRVGTSATCGDCEFRSAYESRAVMRPTMMGRTAALASPQPAALPWTVGTS